MFNPGNPFLPHPLAPLSHTHLLTTNQSTSQPTPPEISRSRRRRCCRSWWLPCAGCCSLCGSGCSTDSSWRRAPYRHLHHHRRRHPRGRSCWCPGPRGAGPGSVCEVHPPCPGSKCGPPLAAPGHPRTTWCHCLRQGSRWRAARRPPPAGSRGLAGPSQRSCMGGGGRDSALVLSQVTSTFTH